MKRNIIIYLIQGSLKRGSLALSAILDYGRMTAAKMASTPLSTVPRANDELKFTLGSN